MKRGNPGSERGGGKGRVRGGRGRFRKSAWPPRGVHTEAPLHIISPLMNILSMSQRVWQAIVRSRRPVGACAAFLQSHLNVRSVLKEIGHIDTPGSAL